MKNTINLSPWYEDERIVEDYLKEAPNKKEIHWFDLPNGTQFLLKHFPDNLHRLGKSNFVSIERLKKACGLSKETNNLIIGIIRTMKGNDCLNVNFPIKFDNLRKSGVLNLTISHIINIFVWLA